ncbi:hypothetical protein [Janthinobacterium sp. LB3P118]|uniref:hypothetical protein n=1 Tax=Janthinobacterium sp. LB3P118 TaxID=3424195 RepID=UPI003F27C404
MKNPAHSNVHDFWLTTCAYDTHHSGSSSALLHTPWNYFTPDGVLVCTLWCDHIATVFDDTEQRRFITLGGEMGAWKGLGKKHGREAEANFTSAIANRRRRIVGFEAEPHDTGDQRRVRHFYMDRACELEPLFGITGDDLIARLDLKTALENINPELKTAVRPGIVFELRPLRVPLAASDTSGLPEAPEAQENESNDDESEMAPAVTVQFARVALPALVEHVRCQHDDVLPTLTYSDLAEMIGWFDKNDKPHARGIGKVLHHVMNLIDSVGSAWKEQLPFLTTVVVAAAGENHGLPESGIESRWPRYQSLSRAEKQARVFAEYTRILDFGARWEQVLSELGLTSGEPCTGSRGGGESDAHRALKEYVLNHPVEFGAQSCQFAQAEYALRSGDSIDVFFRSPQLWIGVEVKSIVSDRLIEDYERGIYQVIKYRAVLQAQAGVDHPHRPPTIRVLLALEGRLPATYRALAQRLGVEVREEVGARIVA